jgi:hypothetical protein
LRIVPSVATKEQVKSKRQKAPKFKSLQMRHLHGQVQKSRSVRNPHNGRLTNKIHRTVFDVNEKEDQIGCVRDGSSAMAWDKFGSNNLIISQSLKNIQTANKCGWVCKGIKDLVSIIK